MIVLGIDPSLTGTALVWGESPAAFERRTFGSKPLGDDVTARVRRLEQLVAQVDQQVRAIGPSLILIEHYSFGSRCGGEYLGEYGGLLRWHLLDHTPNVFEVAPLTLKKFATGKGAGKKEQVIAHITSRYGVILNSNDEYDAFALYQMALVAAGIAEAQNVPQRESVAKVVGTRRLFQPATATP